MEYETSKYSFMASVHNFEVVCAVCGTAPAEKQTMVLAGRTSCPSGTWIIGCARLFRLTLSFLLNRLYAELQRLPCRCNLQRKTNRNDLSCAHAGTCWQLGRTCRRYVSARTLYPYLPQLFFPCRTAVFDGAIRSAGRSLPSLSRGGMCELQGDKHGSGVSD